MFKKHTPTPAYLDQDPREAVNSHRRDFLDFLVKSSASAMALTAAGSLAACGGGDDPVSPVAPSAPAVTPAVTR